MGRYHSTLVETSERLMPGTDRAARYQQTAWRHAVILADLRAALARHRGPRVVTEAEAGISPTEPPKE